MGWALKSRQVGSTLSLRTCFWTFDSLDQAAGFLEETFGRAGRELAGELKRPRLSYNVALYHRTRGAAAPRS